DGGRARDGEGLGQPMQLYSIYIPARSQRQGIGTMLLRRVVNDFFDQGVYSASVWTLREATTARLFYESRGAMLAAEKVEHRPGYDRTLTGYIWPDLRQTFSL